MRPPPPGQRRGRREYGRSPGDYRRQSAARPILIDNDDRETTAPASDRAS